MEFCKSLSILINPSIAYSFSVVVPYFFPLLRGSTALEEPCLPYISYVLALLPTPNLEDQWTTLSLSPILWPVWLGWHCQELTLPPA